MNKTAERAMLARPLALWLGVLAVGWVNPALRGDPLILTLGVLFGGPNFVLWIARGAPGLSRVAPFASPVVGLLGWGALATFTLGLKSPFLAAFFLEIGLATVSIGPAGVLGVTAAAIAVLVLVQAAFGLAGGWQLLLLEAGFLAGMGGLGWIVARRRIQGDAALRSQRDALGHRLEALQRELEDERVISRVGENVARLAHGLKNAVHSLRGFLALIEPEIERSGRAREALAGLRSAIDDLERLARLSLTESGAREPAAPEAASSGAPRGVAGAGRTGDSEAARGASALLCDGLEAVRRALVPAHPEVAFEVRVAPGAQRLRVPLAAPPLEELLTILLRNAVEAMHGVGRCTVEVSRRGARCCVEIVDEGEGLPADSAGRLFTPGFTTKPGGSGFGLFLARRIVEDHGGSLGLASAPGKGAIATLELPSVDAMAQAAAGGASGRS